ncbi:periplasmic protein TonB [Fibrisoma limi BUZ 3]|uniref:Periplasmic protein TonB n=1 Tax=Fibrisoma limi BUZ 3 TaxID=1185876 RepID=I2GFA8_9BACT|nr:energy transducer TonB [Fibrisoma limi]CCH52583.1 periplasmic protein TonB [Fibrisoma limi BUZ 3]
MKLFNFLLIAAFSTLVTFASAQNLAQVSFEKPVSSTDETKNSTAVTVAPSFPGGHNALYAFLAVTVDYPEAARSLGLEGTVRVQFRVKPDGTFEKVRIIQSAGKLLDKAVLDAVAKMPRWMPAQLQGAPVTHWIDFPVTFKLD